ncbi:hypothetical protein [Spiroplasma turonicum]|uniref:Uncharacterized protein n=1 Tax=Spiroplasma turonicum TaxID=216946 RepID=A0A0K1P6N9_9MOLU|nr:hypothetical protein [Spiroplasma turonicum]AKU79973.1 hypothetical protein STURON_00727 [Spiroplasma turonicum]ALX70979.1 hypothetical protein STURO_v1c07260 [Spiroplasma turonicum]
MNDNTKQSGTMLAAYIFMILSTISLSIFVITLAWMIPMTLAVKSRINQYKPSVGLGVCCLFFTGIFFLINGILVLVTNENSYGNVNTNNANNLNQNEQQNQAVTQ